MPFHGSHFVNLVKNEPTVVSTLVGAAVVVLAQFGIPISDELANAITVIVTAAVAWYIRSKVTPTRKLK